MMDKQQAEMAITKARRDMEAFAKVMALSPVDCALGLVKLELKGAMEKHGTFPTLHHAYAVIEEELDELWDEIKKQQPSLDRIRKEAVRVAAMAVRLLLDIDGVLSIERPAGH